MTMSARLPRPAPAARAVRAGAGAPGGPRGPVRRFAEELAAQAFQGASDARRLTEPGNGDRAGQIAPGQPTALQEQLQQRPLHGAEQQRHRECADEQQGGGGDQAEEGVGDAGRVLGDVDHGDDGEPERGGEGAFAGLQAGERGVTGDGAVTADGVAAQAAADPGEAAGAGLLGLQRVLLGLGGGRLGEGVQLLGGTFRVRALLRGLDLLRLRDTVPAEDVARGVDDGDRAELTLADPGEAEAVGGDQQLLRPVRPGQQGEGEQPALAVLEPHDARAEPVLLGELAGVDGGDGDVLAARGEHPAGLDLDDGGAGPLLVDAADLVEYGVGRDRITRTEEPGGAGQVGDALVDRGTHRDGAVLGEVLL